MQSVAAWLALLGLFLTCVTTAPTTQSKEWDIYSFHINSTVTSRYATTVITSRVINRMEESKEIEFHVQIPKNAFISKFRMVIEKQTYDGVVKKKEEAEQQYSQAVSRGQSAGLVSSVGRTLEDFRTSVTVAALSKVTFELTYEELLRRRLGKYELLIHARPMQPVADFKIDAYINEKSGINLLKTTGKFQDTLPNAITKTKTSDQAWVHFYPLLEQQTSCEGCEEAGLNGDLVIVYDVDRADSLGDLVESDGYFIHHFAPNDLPRIPKNVVFIIDRSGSMHGRKMEQTREAMVKILGDLAEDDYFGLIAFDSSVSTWKRRLVQANQDYLNAAKDFARGIQDGGATDINAAVLKGVELLNKQNRKGSASLLILLTDGDPTSGETNLKKIQANVREAIGKRFPLYCLGFGFDVNFDFLTSMSLDNNGVARRIYQESDAALQLQGFYEEVATPLLTDVQMIYLGGTNLTQTNFSQYYNGSEIVVAGQVTSNDIEFTPQVIALSKNNKVEFMDTKSTSQSREPAAGINLNRVWAYLTLKQLLDREVQYSGPEKEQVKEKALELALQYGFVTPHTSMVVTKPEGENTQVAHKPQEGQKAGRHDYGARTPLYSRHRTASQPGVARHPGYHPGVHGHVGMAAPPAPPAPPGLPGPPGLLLYPEMDDIGETYLVPHIQPKRTRGYSPEHVLVRANARIINQHMGPTFGSRNQNIAPTQHSRTHTVPTGGVIRFLLPAVGSALPLCYDLMVPEPIRVLQDPSNELIIDGIIRFRAPAKKSFKKIGVHFQNAMELVLDVSVTPIFTYRNGENETNVLWVDGSTFTAERLTVVMREKELDITVGDARIVIFIEKRDGSWFMWPVLRQRPSGNISGLLASKPVDFEDVSDGSDVVTTLKINNHPVMASRSVTEDYSVFSHPHVACWHIPFQSAKQAGLVPDLAV